MLPQSISPFSTLVSSLKLEVSFAAIFVAGVLLVVFLLSKGDWDGTQYLLNVVGFGCFLLFWSWSLFTCYQRKLSRDWQQRIDKAIKDVSEDAAANYSNNQGVQSMFHSSARLSAFFLGSYTDSQRMNGKELLASTGIINISNSDENDLFYDNTLPNNQLGGNDVKYVDRLISGQAESERGEFTIACGRLSPTTGKCWWLERPSDSNISTGESSSIFTYKKNAERVLVTGTFVRDSGTGRPVVRGQWISRSRRQGTLFLRLNGRPANTEEGGTRDSSSSPNSTPGNQSTNIIHDLEPSDIESGLESEPLVLHRHQPSGVAEKKSQPSRTQPEQPRVVVTYDKTIEALLKAPKKKKSQR